MNARISGRHAVMLVAAALVAAGPQAVAAGPQAVAAAVPAACQSGHAAGADGSRAAVAGARCGAADAGWLSPAAGPLSLRQRRGAGLWAIRGHHVATVLSPGVAGVPEPGAASQLTGCSAPVMPTAGRLGSISLR
jgi:hypothetical protein